MKDEIKLIHIKKGESIVIKILFLIDRYIENNMNSIVIKILFLIDSRYIENHRFFFFFFFFFF